MDGKVRELRDQFCTFTWSRLLYNGMVSCFFSHSLSTVDIINLRYFSTSALSGSL